MANKKKTARNIAVVGTGYWGRNLVRVFQQLGALGAICDTDADNLRQAAAALKGTRPAQRRFEEILADPGIRGVVIATPAGTHARLARTALDAGKDVFVEKPLALETAEGEALVARAEQAGRILMVGHILQYHPAVVKLKELVRAGALGRIYYLYSNRLNFGKIRTEENILWSFAPHDISVMLSLLGEEPESVTAAGGAYLQKDIYDTTMTGFTFRGGVRGHIYVSWLHPRKEQKLVVVGSGKMAVFDDTAADKLVLYSHRVDWIDRLPIAFKAQAEPVPVADTEPLLAEAGHFLERLVDRARPLTDGREGLRVLRVLDACQRALAEGEKTVRPAADRPYFAHPSACLDPGVEIGEGTTIWHFCHILGGSRIGRKCRIGQNVVIGPNVSIGNNVKIQNNVSVYEGVTLEDDVFCGPSMVFTNVVNPRSAVPRMSELQPTLVRRGATIGANATVVCGHTVGYHAFVGAGAVVTRDVPDFALVVGNPARRAGWICACGVRLNAPAGSDAGKASAACPACARQYEVSRDACRAL